MLVLSRTVQRSVVISDSETGEIVATITVLDIRASAVQLGIEADSRYVVDREEVHDKKKAQYHQPTIKPKKKQK